MIIVSLNKLNRLWKNGILPKLNEKVSNAKVLSNIEEIEANTDASNIAGALALKEINNDLAQQPDFIYDASGKITGYKTQAGADTVFPFSSGNAIYLGTGSSFDIKAIYPNWNDLTVDNFICGCNYITGITQSNNVSGRLEYSLSMSKTYKNGILTLGNFSKTQTGNSGQLIGVLNFANSFALLLLPT